MESTLHVCLDNTSRDNRKLQEYYINNAIDILIDYNLCNNLFIFQELTLLVWAPFQRLLWLTIAESRYLKCLDIILNSAHILTAGVCLQPDHQHVRGGVQHRHRHQPRGGHRVGQEEGRGHEDLRGKDGWDDHKQSLRSRTWHIWHNLAIVFRVTT